MSKSYFQSFGNEPKAFNNLKSIHSRKTLNLSKNTELSDDFVALICSSIQKARLMFRATFVHRPGKALIVHFCLNLRNCPKKM